MSPVRQRFSLTPMKTWSKENQCQRPFGPLESICMMGGFCASRPRVEGSDTHNWDRIFRSADGL